MKQETSQWGKAVKKAVIDHDMTLKQLAEKIGYSNATVSQVVNGRYSNSSYKVIAEKINEVLGTEGLPERTETPSDEWCQTVKVELVKQSMTVNELAKQLDVSRDRLSLVINGKMMNEARRTALLRSLQNQKADQVASVGFYRRQGDNCSMYL